MAEEGGPPDAHVVDGPSHEADPSGATPKVMKPLPLNSKRLKVLHVKRIAASMTLPTTGSADEIRQMIEGRLADMGRNPRHVQVLVPEDESAHLQLQDADGVFLDVAPEEGEHSRGTSPEGSERGEEDEITQLRSALHEAQSLNKTLQDELSSLKSQLENEQKKVKEMWYKNCDQLLEFDSILAAKDEEIESLRNSHGGMSAGAHGGASESPSLMLRESLPPGRPRRGKAPPVDVFTGENPEILLDDWLPALQRAATWNGWTQQEHLIQLAGYLRGRARQEWSLLDQKEKDNLDTAIASLRRRLDPGSKTLAAQDFRHTSQKEGEAVSDFIRRLERTFRIAYGRDAMATDTRDTLLHGQLQEGLRFELMRAPAVSGAQNYKELCVAARNEEKRLAELRKRQGYQKQTATLSSLAKKPTFTKPPDKQTSTKPTPAYNPRSCYNCGDTGHFARDCKKKRKESNGRPVNSSRGVKSLSSDTAEPPVEQVSVQEVSDLLSLLYSSESESDDGVRQIRVSDLGSKPRYANVLIEGVSAVGVIDTGADITIVNGALFAKIAAAAKLKKKDFQPANKVPRTYNQERFKLDGRMDLDIAFGGKTMCTPIYIKMDAHDPLLLSEGVCSQLGIVSYHPDVESKEPSAVPEEAAVPTVRVCLLQSVSIPTGQSALIPVRVEGACPLKGPLLLDYDPSVEQTTGLQFEDALLQPDRDGIATLCVSNSRGFLGLVEEGTVLGTAVEAVVVEPTVSDTPAPRHPLDTSVKKVSTLSDQQRRKELLKLVGEPDLPKAEREELLAFLADNHEAFSLEDGERGETDLIQLEIDTGDSPSKRQPLRRMPFAARQEVAKQLHKMQRDGVIQPSQSPWASPVVLVQKKDGSHRFCVDYRGLNSVTKLDTFPLPRIDDLLDQLGESKYFSTLDLASGFWQIRVHPNSQEKTAFVTPQGLFEFRVMPFGLCNAPSVFQRLMQRVLMGLNPAEGPDFVSVYIDDVLVFSRSLKEHLEHLRLVIQRLAEANLKLKPVKCRFACKEVEYLGHLITPSGLKPNPRLVSAVQEFQPPKDVRELRRFLGLTSYYRKFIPKFAKIAEPLHCLTRKEAEFMWSDDCQYAFDSLKQKLVEAPVLAYPSFDKDFILETDASIKGVGAILSQKQDDGKVHPVAFASRALSPPERNYSITELETLAVVWAVSHFHSYLYGHRVTVYTDHSAVKAVLETPNPTGKHARWWTRVYGRGVKQVSIVYRCGKENVAADALSRCPQPADGVKTKVASIRTDTVTSLLQSDPLPSGESSFTTQQQNDPWIRDMSLYLEHGNLPEDESRGRKIAAQGVHFVVLDGILYYIDSKCNSRKRVVVPQQLQQQILREGHCGLTGGHFSGKRTFNALAQHWWWEHMYRDTVNFCKSCPECAIVSGVGRRNKPPLCPIPVQRPFQIVGVDVMELPKTSKGNKYVIVFQDFATKWPLVFPAPDQLTIRIARLLAEQIVPFFGVPDALLSDRGTNLLSHLMLDVCKLLGIKKLNTTAYHPQCDGMVERFNRTLKSMIRKHVTQFGKQWDQYLPGLLWAYRNTPHESTGEKPSYLLFGMDCRSPTEAALLPPSALQPVDVEDYREELILSLSSARSTAAECIQKAQAKYKAQYDRKATSRTYRPGEWILVRFPCDETGKQRKLSRPWHGPYRVLSTTGPDVTAQKVYFPEDGQIQIHQSRVSDCPPRFPAGYYWYGENQRGPGQPPRWVQQLLSVNTTHCEPEQSDEPPKKYPSRTRLPPSRLM